jgi:hypothetical protein
MDQRPTNAGNSAWERRIQIFACFDIWDSHAERKRKKGPASSKQVFVLSSFFSFFDRRDTGELHDVGDRFSSILTKGRFERQFSVSDLG